MTQPTNTDLADALHEIANTLPLGSALVVRLAADRLTDGADADGWIECSGGQCPVKNGTNIEIRFRDGDTGPTDIPEQMFWGEFGNGTIEAYRILP